MLQIFGALLWHRFVIFYSSYWILLLQKWRYVRSVHLMRNLVQEKSAPSICDPHILPFYIICGLVFCFIYCLFLVLQPASHFHCSIHDSIRSSHLHYIYIALQQYKQSSYCIQSLLTGDLSIFVFLLVLRSHRDTYICTVEALNSRVMPSDFDICFFSSLVLVVQMGIY